MRKKKTDSDHMFKAIQAARKGIRTGQTPFGALIVLGDRILACEHNSVWHDCDITAHAEIRAIRSACLKIGKPDLSGCVLYSTCEPCPMCFSAIHWARISRIVYGATIQDARILGFNELPVSNRQIKSLSGSPVKVTGPFKRNEALSLFRDFASRKQSRLY